MLDGDAGRLFETNRNTLWRCRELIDPDRHRRAAGFGATFRDNGGIVIATVEIEFGARSRVSDGCGQPGDRGRTGIDAVCLHRPIDCQRLQVIDGYIGSELGNRGRALPDGPAIGLDRCGDLSIVVAENDVARNVTRGLLCGQSREQERSGKSNDRLPSGRN